MPHWLPSSASGLAPSSDSMLAEYDAPVPEMPLTQGSMTNVGQAELQHTFNGPGASYLTRIMHSPPDARLGAQNTPQDAILAAPASPGSDKGIDDSSGQYSDVEGSVGNG